MKWIIGLVILLSGAQLIGLSLPINTTITDGSTCVRTGDERTFTYQGGRLINPTGFVLYTLEKDSSSYNTFMMFPNGRNRQVSVLSNNEGNGFSLLRLLPGTEWLIFLKQGTSVKPIFECFTG